jgi:hypothetical protein
MFSKLVDLPAPPVPDYHDVITAGPAAGLVSILMPELVCADYANFHAY